MKAYHGTREAFAAALLTLAEQDPSVLFVSCDSLKAMRAVAFAERYPDRTVECGIAEQGGIDTAAGLAACGCRPFVGTYAGFLTMRACEQMRTFVAYPNLNVKFIGINAGLIGGEREGVTHQFYEDLAIVSALPHFTIFTPADAAQTYHAVLEAYKTPGPVYVRCGSGREPDVYEKDAAFSETGVTIHTRGSGRVVLFSCGFVLDRVLAAAELLEKRGIAVTVADINRLYGARPEAIVRLLEKAEHVFTIEDHNINGGLGSYICHLACAYAPVRVQRIGLSSFGESGPAKELTDAYGLSPEAIAKTVETACKEAQRG